MKKLAQRAGLALATGLAVVGCTTATTSHKAVAHQKPLPTLPANTTPPSVSAQPTPNPSGTAKGSCDYTLSNNFSGTGNDHLIAEIDLTNTGNVGEVVKVTVKWPQEGYAPIRATKTVHSPYGASDQVVRFHVPVPESGNVINLLQSWEERHNLPNNDCKYKTVIESTYGPAH